MDEKPDDMAALKAQIQALKSAILSMNNNLAVAINYGITADEMIRALVETHADPAAVLAAYKRKAGEVDTAVTYEVIKEAQVLESLERQRRVAQWISKIIEDRQAAAG